jgi:short-subunit dehydrogenase
VTGTSSGLGKALAETYAAEGAKTVLAARRNEMLDEIAAQINGKGQIAFVIAADVTTEADVARLSKSMICR